MSSDPKSQRVALAFLEQFWADQDAGEEKGLGHYLSRYPDQEELIAAEYLAALAELRGDGAAARAEPEGGEGRLGPYRLVSELGRGGQGVVWLAEDSRLNNRKVALKVLTGLGPGAESHLARFRREAALASKLEHPNICGVHDTGIEGGVPYIAMRYVEGETLADRLTTLRSGETMAGATTFLAFDDEGGKAGPATVTSGTSTTLDRSELDRIVLAFEKIAHALHAAHEQGIIHRDIKPGNIMVTPQREPVILDFGLARDDSDDSGPSLTQTGDLFGTPAYMSPEQITGRRVILDRRSDIYSLGATLYECLTMRRPFEAPTREALYQAIMSKEALPVRKLNRQIPADLEVVLQCAMDKDRDRRYQTAADLAEDLRRVRQNEPILARKVGVLGRAWRWSKRRPAAAALVAALVLGIPTIAGLGAWWWTSLDDVRAQEEARAAEALERQVESGLFELQSGDKKKAVAAFERALAVDPRSVEAVVGLARARMRLEEHGAALAAIERGEEVVDRPGLLLRTKAQIVEKLGREAEAAALREAAPPIAGRLMWFLAGLEKLEEAEALHPMDSRWLPTQREAADLLGRAVTASERVRRAYLYLLAAALKGCGDEERTAIVCDSMASLWPDSAETQAFIAYACVGVDPGRAERACRRAIELNPDLPRPWGVLGGILGERKEFAEALEARRTEVRLDPENDAARINLGGLYKVMERHEEALACYDEALRINPSRSFAHEFKAQSYYRLGRLDEAEASARASLERYPKNPPALALLGRIAAERGRVDEALSILRDVVAAHPDYVLGLHYLSATLGNAGRDEEALPYALEVVELLPDEPYYWANLGETYRSLRRLDEAEEAYRKALEIDPDWTRGRLRRAMILLDQDRLEDATKECEEAARRAPESAEAHRDLASCLNNLRRFDEAIAISRRGQEIAPKNAHFPYCIAFALLNQGRVTAAVAAVREALALDPGAHYIAGFAQHCEMVKKQMDAQLARLRETLVKEPENVDYLNALAWSLVAPEGDPAIRDPDEALSLARRAAALTKREKPEILDTLAVALAAKGELAEAVQVQEEILRLLDGRDTEFMKVADAEAMLERYRKALAASTDD